MHTQRKKDKSYQKCNVAILLGSVCSIKVIKADYFYKGILLVVFSCDAVWVWTKSKGRL